MSWINMAATFGNSASALQRYLRPLRSEHRYSYWIPAILHAGKSITRSAFPRPTCSRLRIATAPTWQTMSIHPILKAFAAAHPPERNDRQEKARNSSRALQAHPYQPSCRSQNRGSLGSPFPIAACVLTRTETASHTYQLYTRLKELARGMPSSSKDRVVIGATL